jgi:malate permease and related proteins
MLSALGSVLSIILAITIGLILAKRGWFEGNSAELISRLVVNVALPAYMVANLMGGYDRDKLLSLVPGLPVPFAVMLITYALGRALSVIFKVKPERRGTFATMFALSNTIFVGLPVNLVLFGEASLLYVLLYYIANTTVFWTIGVYAIASDGAQIRHGSRPPFVSFASLQRIFSPPLTSFLAAVVLILLGFKLPAFALDFCKMLGSMTTPLSMLFIGIVISRVEWRKVRLERDLLLIFIGRFLVAPSLLILIVRPTNLPLLMKEVFFVQAAMPAMTQAPILAKTYGADAEYAGLGTALSTGFSLITIPLCMALVPMLF